MPILNSLGLDAMTAHWEFAYGPEAFKQRAAELSYPMLAINVFCQATKERLFPPYNVKEIGGLRIGLVGIASNIVGKTMPPPFSEGLEFTLGREELPPIIDVLRTQEKVDLIVLISHLGFSQDMKLLSEVGGIDVCLSGHTHNRLYKPALQVKPRIEVDRMEATPRRVRFVANESQKKVRAEKMAIFDPQVKYGPFYKAVHYGAENSVYLIVHINQNIGDGLRSG